MSFMSNYSNSLLTEIEVFLSETRMSASYFGKLASGNSELVKRLRDGRRIWPETDVKIRAFIMAKRQEKKAEKVA